MALGAREVRDENPELIRQRTRKDIAVDKCMSVSFRIDLCYEAVAGPHSFQMVKKVSATVFAEIPHGRGHSNARSTTMNRKDRGAGSVDVLTGIAEPAVAGGLPSKTAGGLGGHEKARLFDSSIVGTAQEAVDFITNILESSTEYSVIAKDLDGKILLWNEGARRLYGYEPEEVVEIGRAHV